TERRADFPTGARSARRRGRGVYDKVLSIGRRRVTLVFPLQYIVIAECSRRCAHNLDPPDTWTGVVLLGRAGAGRWARDGTRQRLKAVPQAAEVIHQAPEQIDERSGPRQTATETDRAQAPATAEPERGIFAMGFKRFPSQERRSCLSSQQTLENRRGFLFP